MIEKTAPQERLASATTRRASYLEASTRLQKLTVGLAPLALTSSNVRRLKLLASAEAYVTKIEEATPGLKRILATVRNELKSFHDGIRSGEAQPQDLHPQAIALAASAVREKAERLSILIAQLQVSGAAHQDENMLTIERNRQFREKLPNLGGTDKEAAIARMPVMFTFRNKQKHSSVGYVSLDALSMLGFKVENVAGYTIIHNQLMVGVNHKAIRRHVRDKETGDIVRDEQGRPVMELDTTSESTIKFSGGKPVKKVVKRDKTLKDVADQVVRELNQKTRKDYAFVSPSPTSMNGAGWFWIMPAADIRRLAKAMPGNHVGISEWGFGS